MQRALWEANFHRKKTYGLVIMKLFIFKIFFVNFFSSIFELLFVKCHSSGVFLASFAKLKVVDSLNQVLEISNLEL